MAARADGGSAPATAQRRSRRGDIIEAAVRRFARQGFVDTAIADVADEAGVVATAVYYHFSGKDELYAAAVTRVFDSIGDVVTEARGDDPDGRSLDRVIDAVWDWIDDHPDEATLLYLQLPGATERITALRRDFEEQHVQRALGYFPHEPPRVAAGQLASRTLTARTLVDLLVSVHTMRLADGPLSDEPTDALKAAVHEVGRRLVGA